MERTYLLANWKITMQCIEKKNNGEVGEKWFADLVTGLGFEEFFAKTAKIGGLEPCQVV